MEKMVKCRACGKEIAKSAKTCPHCGARQKKHKVIGVFLVIVGIILIIAAFGGSSGGAESPSAEPKNSQSAVSTPPQESSSAESKNKETISLDEFNAIETGMTYEEVVEIIGSEGTVMSEVDIGAGSDYKTTMYTWEGEGSIGANANITIQGGKVVSKAQLGLK